LTFQVPLNNMFGYSTALRSMTQVTINGRFKFLSFWKCEVFLAQYLSVHTDLFHFLQGKGEFTMEYKEHSAVSQDVQLQLVNTYKASKTAE